MAEAIFLHQVRERELLDKFDIDSCGTGQWHVGERADPRAIQIAKKNGVDVSSIARQLDPGADFGRFELFVAMDRENLNHLIGAGASAQQVRLMRSFDPAHAAKPGEAPDVPDPYFGEGDGFKDVFEMLTVACSGMLDELS